MPKLVRPAAAPMSLILFRLTMRNAVERAWIGGLRRVRGNTDELESPR
jgi:hypothetical protein